MDFGSRTFLLDFSEARTADSVSSSPRPTPEAPSSPLSCTELDEEGVGVVEGGGGVSAWACCEATRSGLILGFRVLVPFLTSHMEHLKASALLRKVQTLQSQKLSSDVEGPGGTTTPLDVLLRLKHNHRHLIIHMSEHLLYRDLKIELSC